MEPWVRCRAVQLKSNSPDCVNAKADLHFCIQILKKIGFSHEQGLIETGPFFGLKLNIYACFVYYSPRDSRYNQNSDIDILESISNEM